MVSIDRTDEVLGTEHDPPGGIELDDLVAQRDPPAEERADHFEGRADTDRVGGQVTGLDDARVPLGRRAEAAQVVEGGLGRGRAGETGLVAGHGLPFEIVDLRQRAGRQPPGCLGVA